MKTYTRIYLLMFLMLSAGFSFTQSEDELFYDAGYSFFEKDYPNAHTKVSDGLVKYPGSKKLKALKDLICEKWTCPDDAIIGAIDGGDTPPVGDECLSDSDGDGICDAVDKCPDKWGTASHRGCPDSDGDGIYDDLDRCPYESGSRANNGCPRVEPPPRPPGIRNIRANLKHSTVNKSLVTWNSLLSANTDQMILSFKMQDGPRLVKRYDVSRLDEFEFCPGDGRWQGMWVTVQLNITSNNENVIITDSLVLDRQLFPCECED